LTPHLSVASYFAPTNWADLNANDLDLGSTGATLLPRHLVFSIGKDGVGYLLNDRNLGGIGGQLFSSRVCVGSLFDGEGGAWGGTAFAAGIVYVPCAGGVAALAVQTGATPRFSSLWNYTGIFAGPPIIAAGAVWTFDIFNGDLYALNPQTGAFILKMPLGPLRHFTTPSAGGGLIFVASENVVRAINPAPSTPLTSKLTVTTQNTNGQTITGYYTVLYQGGSIVATGFSPVVFPLNNGETYTVQVQDYGSCHFDHWADTGSTSASRIISISSDTQITAVYNCG